MVDIKPLAGDVRADIGLVLMIGSDHLDLQSLFGGAEVFDRHARGHDRSRAGDIGIKAGHIVHDADADDAVGDLLSPGRAAGHQRGKAGGMANALHLGSSRGPGAISVAREDRSENAAQRLTAIRPIV